MISQVAFTCCNIWKERCYSTFNKTLSPLQAIHEINCACGIFTEAARRNQKVATEMQTNSSNF